MSTEIAQQEAAGMLATLRIAPLFCILPLCTRSRMRCGSEVSQKPFSPPVESADDNFRNIKSQFCRCLDFYRLSLPLIYLFYTNNMNECVVITGALLCLVAAVGYGVALGTKYWVITSWKVFGSSLLFHNRGLFEPGCANLDCSKFDVEQFLQNTDVGSKVAAAGVILAGLSSVIAAILLFCSTCNKSSGAAKAGGGFGVFAVLLAVAGIVTYVVLALRQDESNVIIEKSFGYSLYVAGAAGGVDLLATLFACAGA